ncbi:histidine phosphatase superfamily, partial [Blyttiomyces helicus]
HIRGLHNVAEAKYGTGPWDDYYSKLPLYFDAPLTPLGQNQTRLVHTALIKNIQAGFPLPTHGFVSPLSRTLSTAQNIYTAETSLPNPLIVLESFREQYGIHTCDARRTRTELERLYPAFDYSRLEDDLDQLWDPEIREEVHHVDERVKRAVVGIFEEFPEDDGVAVVAHGGIVEAFFAITGHRDFFIAPGGLLPIVVKAVGF